MLPLQEPSMRPITTAHLAQTMSLLVLSHEELREKILEELDLNPALELVEEPRCPSCSRRVMAAGRCPACTLKHQADDPIVFLSTRESRHPRTLREDEAADRRFEPVAPEDLTADVLRQLATDLKPSERRVAAYVLACLDEDGFLTEPPAVIARLTRSSLAEVEAVLRRVAGADPPGLATAGPQKALLAQLDALKPPTPIPLLARIIIEDSFKDMCEGRIGAIARQHEAPAAEVREAIRFIRQNLNPYPKRAFYGSGRQPSGGDSNVYYSPDVAINRVRADAGEQLIVEIFAPIAGWLRIDPAFQRVAPKGGDESSEEWSDHLERASLFVKCIQQRGNTMRRMMRILVSAQRDFILQGNRYLLPMTRAEIAAKLGVHESTVSRAVKSKSVALPDGRIIPLRRFFDRSLPVRQCIKDIIASEDKPLTDEKISQILKEEGICVARRTVAKYRDMMQILPSRLRNGGKPGSRKSSNQSQV